MSQSCDAHLELSTGWCQNVSQQFGRSPIVRVLLVLTNCHFHRTYRTGGWDQGLTFWHILAILWRDAIGHWASGLIWLNDLLMICSRMFEPTERLAAEAPPKLTMPSMWPCCVACMWMHMIHMIIRERPCLFTQALHSTPNPHKEFVSTAEAAALVVSLTNLTRISWSFQMVLVLVWYRVWPGPAFTASRRASMTSSM